MREHLPPQQRISAGAWHVVGRVAMHPVPEPIGADIPHWQGGRRYEARRARADRAPELRLNEFQVAR